MKAGDLVQVRGFSGGPVRNMIPGHPLALGIVIQPGTPAVVVTTGPVMSHVLIEDKMLWIYNEHMEVTNAAR